ncbi:hypothetical protein pb186bvf_007758 [Paramecium bursaria]
MFQLQQLISLFKEYNLQTRQQKVIDQRQSFSLFIFNQLLNFDLEQKRLDKRLASIYCKICSTEIGKQVDTDYSLYGSCARQCEKNHKFVSITINQTLTNLIQIENIDNLYIPKKELENFTPKQYSGAFIIHKLEQRVLLLGLNGLYNNIFEKLWQSTLGNVILVLINQDQQSISDIVYNLCEKGAQPILLDLYNSDKLVFYNQNTDFHNLAQRFTYKLPCNIKVAPSTKEITHEKEELITFYKSQIKRNPNIFNQSQQIYKLLCQEDEYLNECYIF